jgi:hypothetical protein
VSRNVPHDDLAVVATARDDVVIRGAEREAENILWRLQDQLNNKTPENKFRSHHVRTSNQMCTQVDLKFPSSTLRVMGNQSF